MAKTIANVLTGVAELGVRQPNDAIAEWSIDHGDQAGVGSYSVKLYKSGSGDAGSTHVQISPTPSTTITMATVDADPTDFSFWHWIALNVTGNFGQYEMVFEDRTPGSQGRIEVTVPNMQAYTGTGAWVKETLALTDLIGYYGVGEAGGVFGDWTLGAGNDIQNMTTVVDAQPNVAACSGWQLTRVRIELWEPAIERTMYVDTIEIDATTYAIEPGAATPGLTLSSPYVDVGYTEDGVTITYTADEADIEVEEETFPIDRVLTKETAEITCNMAESSLYNINNAMAGAVLSGSILTLGAGVNKTMNLRIHGTNPLGFIRDIFIPLATATGAVGMAYKKGEKTMVPVTFQALKGDEPAVTIVDVAA